MALLSGTCWCLVVQGGSVCSFVLLGAAWRCSGVLNGAPLCLVIPGGVVCLSRAAWRWLMVGGGSWWCRVAGSCGLMVLGGAWWCLAVLGDA